jgi:hypothetical protein
MCTEKRLGRQMKFSRYLSESTDQLESLNNRLHEISFGVLQLLHVYRWSEGINLRDLPRGLEQAKNVSEFKSW